MIFPSSGILTRSEGGVTQVSTLLYSVGWEDGAVSDSGARHATECFFALKGVIE
jgi:hypothetical protein